MEDFYKILGLGRGASQDEIKRAYRKKAHQFHPDKAGSDKEKVDMEAKFKQINQAYQVLSDADKKSRYDQFGHAGVDGVGFGGASTGSPFGRSPFGGRSGGFQFDFGGGQGFGGGMFGDILEDLVGSAFSTVQAEVRVSLSQAVLGGSVQLKTTGGEAIELTLPPCTQDGQTFVFRGKGHQTRRGRGDLHITVSIELPRRLSREQKELFEKLKQTGI